MQSRQNALSVFLAEVERRAYRHAFYAVRDEEAALDIVQDTMLRLAERYADRPQEEWPLLFQRILQNAIRDHFRRSKVRNWWVTLFSAFRRDDDDEGDDPLEWLPDQSGSANPEREREQAQTMALIEAGIARLPTRQREAFLLRYWEEFDVAETAEIMGCSQGSVKTHCSRATQALAEWMRQHGVDWQGGE
ncbi:RNA polymerase sigma factor [Chitiniphilus shinanonensis]|uniref:RNA polymerase sigma factor n=1 Tax=Chitiniphilus shinanonensis TaxID=553088 RepID=A0ABQ6BPI6_9NEIS|nr:RNA polymerase sigma factor [Chitiniphilus shinanonensis]GLS03955.1 RNA polymerase sigma factor [Chitiniphilus shinanonensis]